MRRRLPRLPVIQELQEPLRKQIGIRYFGFRITPDRSRGGFGPYPGDPRVWADFSLREWATTAPGVLYRTTPQEAAAMDAIAARLRRSGEGAQVLWGLDLWGEAALFPSDLVCIGPRLSDKDVDDVEQLFATYPGEHLYGRDAEPNEHSTYNGVRCYETTWSYGVAPAASV